MAVRLALFLSISLCSASSLVASAQEADLESGALARSLFHEGVELVEDERWPEAEERFRRVMALRPTPVVAFNLASTLEHTGKLVEASELLRGIIRDEGAREAVRVSADALLAQVVPRIARLTIHVEGPGSEDVVVTIDDDAVSAAHIGVAVPIDPGSHVLATTRDSEVLDRATVNLVEGGDFELTLDAPARVPTAEEAAAAAQGGQTSSAEAGEESDPAITSRWWFWAGAGALVVAAVIVIIAVAAAGATPEPIQGDLDPPVLRGMP